MNRQAFESKEYHPTMKSGHFEFPFKLHRLLEDAAAEGKEDVVSWLPCDTAFRVHNRAEFEETILPRYFNGGRNILSFHRQLQIYGFERLTDRNHREEYGGYWHAYFVRGEPGLSSMMKRRTVKSPSLSKTKRQQQVQLQRRQTTPPVPSLLGLLLTVPRCGHLPTLDDEDASEDCCPPRSVVIEKLLEDFDCEDIDHVFDDDDDDEQEEKREEAEKEKEEPPRSSPAPAPPPPAESSEEKDEEEPSLDRHEVFPV